MRAQRDTPPDFGLAQLLIPQRADLDFHLNTHTAKRLFQRGAKLYIMADGETHALSLKRPRGSFFRAVSLNVLQPKEFAL